MAFGKKPYENIVGKGDRFWALTRLNTFADNKFNVAKMLSSVFDRVENIVGKGENAGYQHFLLFSQCFPSNQRIIAPSETY